VLKVGLTAVTALPDGTLIGYGPLVDDAGAFPAFLDVPEEGGAHVVVLDDKTVLMSAHAPRSTGRGHLPDRADWHGPHARAEGEGLLPRVQDKTHDEVVPEALGEMAQATEVVPAHC
jgi:hypothetical protein